MGVIILALYVLAGWLAFYAMLELNSGLLIVAGLLLKLTHSCAGVLSRPKR